IVGRSTPEGASGGGQRREASDSSQQAGTRTLLLHPLLEALVVATTPETVLDEGLPFDRCDIAIVTSPERSGTAPGGTGNGTGDWLRSALVLAQAVDRTGTLILNADERNLDERKLTDDVGDGLSVIYTSAGRDNAAVDGHRARGGRCVLERDGRIVLTEGGRETEVMRIRRGWPAGGMAQTLCAVAAGRAAGFPPRVIAQALAADDEGGRTSS